MSVGHFNICLNIQYLSELCLLTGLTFFLRKPLSPVKIREYGTIFILQVPEYSVIIAAIGTHDNKEADLPRAQHTESS